MEIIEEPHVVQRVEMPYLGIRIVTPFRGMLAVRDDLLNELHGWVQRNDVVTAGPYFLRLHVVNMSGPMDIEVGVVTTLGLSGDKRVRPAVLPAGRYATLTYREHDIRANRTLIDWARANGAAFDRRDVPAGDWFACRYEAFLTDPWSEPHRKKWKVQLNFLVADPL